MEWSGFFFHRCVFGQHSARIAVAHVVPPRSSVRLVSFCSRMLEAALFPMMVLSGGCMLVCSLNSGSLAGAGQCVGMS